MSRAITLLFAALTAVCANAAAPKQCDDPAAAIPLTGKSCDNKLAAPQVSCLVPDEVQGALAQPNLNTVQRAADIFSWQQFIALNWPAAEGRRGQPATGLPVTANGPRVWESWKEGYEVYLADGKKPAAWDHAQPIPAACQGTGKWLMRSTKVSDVVDKTLQALPTDHTLPAELKDQRGRLLRYEIRLNRPLFDYIVKQRLYDGTQQVKAAVIDFPVGSQLVKAAWRELDGEDIPYFLATDACVCDDPGDGTPSRCTVKKMGLAGFHIMTKTAAAPQWIWSTFEQVDNVTRIHPEVAPLNDPACPTGRCPSNLQTADGIPTQLSRVIPVPNQDPDCSRPDQAVDNIAVLNQDVQKAKALTDSFLRYYQLVGTQWPLHGRKEPVKTAFAVLPELLANTTMESFSQNTSSCMGCHAMSRSLNPDRYVSGDFSFTLNNAKPQPKGARCVDVEASGSCSDAILGPPPAKPRDAWEREHWQQIQLGYQVTTRTYELAGPKYVGSRLHCESCHLNAGGNPDAAWWVDMARYYPTPTSLQDRINGCFERSMNGYPLCSTEQGPAACDANPIMSGLTTYMAWLTREYRARHPDGKPARGYPAFKTGNGDSASGGRIYTQKCAFCHNNDGQGRYANHTYFRPALWGPNSFNACAGMSSPGTLAAFLHANMPYTSGGMLTPAEANDLAAFIDAQCRPGKGGVGPNGEICSLAPGCADGHQTQSP